MAKGDGTRSADWDIEDQVPLLALLIWETNAQENTRSPSPGLWEASPEEAPTTGKHRTAGSTVYDVKMRDSSHM